MRTPYALLFLSVSVPSALCAQLGMLTSDEMLPPGSVVTQRELGNFSAIDTITGPSAVWNLTDVVAFGPSFTNDIMLPASTPHAATFPSSNYVIYESVIPRYNYYALTSSSFARVGGYATQASIYNDPQIEIVFPLQYGDTQSDTWDNNLSGVGGGTYRYACIGRGVLQLPGATYSDVLLVRVVLFELFDIEVYVWYDATNGAQLVLYYPGDGFFVPEGAAFATNLLVGIDQADEGIGLRVHGVAQGRLPITYSAQDALRYRIADTAGRRVQEGNLPATSTALTTFLEVGSLNAGLYLLQLSDNEAHRTVRFLVE